MLWFYYCEDLQYFCHAIRQTIYVPRVLKKQFDLKESKQFSKQIYFCMYLSIQAQEKEERNAIRGSHVD